MDPLTTARSWIDQGFSVFPVGYRNKRPAFEALRWVGSVNSENVGTWEPYKQRQARDDELKLWFGSGPIHNVGIITGFNNLVVLDFDQIDAYVAWMQLMPMMSTAIQAVMACTYRVYSRRGVHVYLRVSEPVESYQVGVIDVKARWGYVLVPPSVHPSGHVYRGEGSTIMGLDDLREIFPFSPPPSMMGAKAPICNDPYEVASHAVNSVGGMGVVAQIKSALTIGDLLGQSCADGRRRIVCCPIHNDRNPSLYLYPDGSYHCFGCGAHGGDVIDFVAQLNRVTNREAIALLAERLDLHSGS